VSEISTVADVAHSIAQYFNDWVTKVIDTADTNCRPVTNDDKKCTFTQHL